MPQSPVSSSPRVFLPAKRAVFTLPGPAAPVSAHRPPATATTRTLLPLALIAFLLVAIPLALLGSRPHLRSLTAPLRAPNHKHPFNPSRVPSRRYPARPTPPPTHHPQGGIHPADNHPPADGPRPDPREEGPAPAGADATDDAPPGVPDPPPGSEGTRAAGPPPPPPEPDPLLTIVTAPPETKGGPHTDAPGVPGPEDDAEANPGNDPDVKGKGAALKLREGGHGGEHRPPGSIPHRATEEPPRGDPAAKEKPPPPPTANNASRDTEEGQPPPPPPTSEDDAGGGAGKEPPRGDAGSKEKPPPPDTAINASRDTEEGQPPPPPPTSEDGAGGDDGGKEPSRGDAGNKERSPPPDTANDASPNTDEEEPVSLPAIESNTSTAQVQAPPQPKAPSPSLPRHATRMVVVTDLWERMVNMQHALCALLLYGLERDFTVVEPFVFESRAINEFSTPEHFRQKGMKPQPASLYFDLSALFDTGHFVSHQTLRQRVTLEGQEGQSVVNAAVLVPWDEPRASHKGRKFYWCDDRFDSLVWNWKSSQYGREIAPGFHVQRLLCINPYHTMSPVGNASASYYDDLFAFADSGTKHLARACAECVSITLINYRKHLFDGIEPSAKRKELLKKTYVPLLVGKELQQVAKRVAKEALGGKKYVGIQMRTGKPYDLLLKYKEDMKSSGKVISPFEKWLRECSATLVKRAKALAEEVERDGDVGFYMASDMVNSGWKGGEWASPKVAQLLNESLEYFKRELGDVYWFEPERFGIKQDIMGASGAVDAAVVYFADKFVYSLPSSLGMWVGLQRKHYKRSKAVVEDCMMPEFDVVEDWMMAT